MKTIRLLLKLAASLIIWFVCPSVFLWIFIQPGKIDTAPLAIALFGAWLAGISTMKLTSLVRKLTASLAADSEMMRKQTEAQRGLIQRLNESTCLLDQVQKKLHEANIARSTQAAWISSQQTCWACSENKKIMDSKGIERNNTDV